MATDEVHTKVLLVDDEKMLLELYRSKFQESGFDVFACSDADDALKVLRYGYKPDVILFDINMPGMGGYEFLELIKKEKLGAQRHIAVALTNQGHDAEKKYTAELGADAHILKSDFTPAEVVARIGEIMKKAGIERS
jgi:CheY-like chemotaxis protein